MQCLTCDLLYSDRWQTWHAHTMADTCSLPGERTALSTCGAPTLSKQLPDQHIRIHKFKCLILPSPLLPSPFPHLMPSPSPPLPSPPLPSPPGPSKQPPYWVARSWSRSTPCWRVAERESSFTSWRTSSTTLRSEGQSTKHTVSASKQLQDQLSTEAPV